jgi:hypothetical protein
MAVARSEESEDNLCRDDTGSFRECVEIPESAAFENTEVLEAEGGEDTRYLAASFLPLLAQPPPKP